jgi:acetoin utilization deacetylase AcuC-like enzyme
MVDLKIFSHPDCAKHEMGAGHPEQPGRVIAVDKALRAAGHLSAANEAVAPQVSRDVLELVHPEYFIDDVEAASPTRGYVALDPDTTMNPHSLSAAKHAVGAAVAAVEWVMQSNDTAHARRAFCNVRPPGHHALQDRAMGFCIFSTVAIAAKYAVNTCGAKRVAIVDFDVHHGNGTEACVARDDRIRLYSTFQYPYYPHSGVPGSAANIVNVPLHSGSGAKEVRNAFERTILPDMAAFAPELILISAGFDAHRDDPLASLNFTEDDYAWITAQLVAQANASAQGRIVSSLEGGYNLEALASSAVAHVDALRR